MKDISIKEICLIIITLCVVATTYNRWNIGRYQLDAEVEGESRWKFLTDTKTGLTYREGLKDWYLVAYFQD